MFNSLFESQSRPVNALDSSLDQKGFWVSKIKINEEMKLAVAAAVLKNLSSR